MKKRIVVLFVPFFVLAISDARAFGPPSEGSLAPRSLSDSSGVLSNSSLTGKYFLRHVEFRTDNNNNATDARSISGTITFDGAGNYVIAGQQVINTAPVTGFGINGTYSVSPAGTVTLTNPQNTALTINARFGTEAVMGSSTDASGNVFDTFVAIPAPAAGASFSNATLGGTFHMADFEMPGAKTQQVQVSGATAVFTGSGTVATFRPVGHSAANGGNTLNTQEFTAGYTVAGDGTGTITFEAAGSINPGPALLGSSVRNLYVSATRNMFLAVLPSGHDILVGILNATTQTNVSFNGRYWLNGLGVNAGGSSVDFVASTSVITNASTVFITSRAHQVPSAAAMVPALLNQTSTQGYAFLLAGLGMGCGCGIGSAPNGNVVVAGSNFLMEGANGTLVGVSPSVDVNGNANSDTVSYLILFGEQIPSLTGAGVFLNPQGIVNAATYAPVGDYISPGEFIQLYGSGFVASGTMTAGSLPFPKTLDNVTVTINNVQAPIYYVDSGRIICIVPFELTGTTATIVVTSGQTPSNSVTVGAQPASPGVFSANDSGYGDGAITHVTGLNVNTANPAQNKETVQMYVSGLGALLTPVADGDGAAGIDDAVAKPRVYIDNTQADVGYWGLTVDAGLYQINFTIPDGTPTGEYPVTIVIPNGATGASTATVTIAVQSATTVQAGV